MRTHQYWVCMVTNKGNTVLYIGVTNDIEQRLFDHRVGTDPGSFAWRYQCWKLVYLEEFNDIKKAIAREEQLKNWKREWKDALIAKENPAWRDLSTDWDYSSWYDPNDPPLGYYQQGIKEEWGGPIAMPGQARHDRAVRGGGGAERLRLPIDGYHSGLAPEFHTGGIAPTPRLVTLPSNSCTSPSCFGS